MKWASTPAAEAGSRKEARGLASFVPTATVAKILPPSVAVPVTSGASETGRSPQHLDVRVRSMGIATGRSMKWNDPQVSAQCAFVDWDLTSSRFYTVLTDLLESKITRLLTE